MPARLFLRRMSGNCGVSLEVISNIAGVEGIGKVLTLVVGVYKVLGIVS